MSSQSMEISITSLPSEGRKINVRLGTGPLSKILLNSDIPGLEAIEPLIAKISLKPFNSCVRVKGSLSTHLSCQCVRCLERFSDRLDSCFEFIFQPETQMHEEEEELELSSEDLDIVPLSGPSLDLFAIIEEQFFLALHPNPVCSDKCCGLCPNCGGNLNTDHCECSDAVRDSRFAKLESWKLSHFPKSDSDK